MTSRGVSLRTAATRVAREPIPTARKAAIPVTRRIAAAIAIAVSRPAVNASRSLLVIA